MMVLTLDDALLDQVWLELELRKDLKLPVQRAELELTKKRVADNLQEMKAAYSEQEIDARKLSVYLPYLNTMRERLTTDKDYTGSALEKEKTLQAIDEFIRDLVK